MDSRQQSVLVQYETTYGTDPGAWSGTTHGTILWDWQCNIENQEGYSRSVQAAFNARRQDRPNYLGGRHMSWSARQELRGIAGGALTQARMPPFHYLLIGAGFVADWNHASYPGVWSYWPTPIGAAGSDAEVAGNVGSCSIQYHRGGLQYTLTGARSGWRIEIPARQPASIYYVGGLARYTVPAAAAFVGSTPANELAPVTAAATSFAPYTWSPTAAEFGHVAKVTIDGRVQTEITESLSLGAEGLGVVRNLGRGTTEDPGIAMTLEVEQPNGVHPNDADLWISNWATQLVDTGTPSISLGSAAGNTIVLKFGGLHVIRVDPILIGRRLGHRVECRLMQKVAGNAEDDLIITAV